jgi:predicted nucleic acid binding AN1-type Zn finger protein
VKIVGECRYCQSSFCSKHRLVEAHACSKIDSCKSASHAKLESKLMNEKTVASKV